MTVSEALPDSGLRQILGEDGAKQMSYNSHCSDPKSVYLVSYSDIKRGHMIIF